MFVTWQHQDAAKKLKAKVRRFARLRRRTMSTDTYQVRKIEPPPAGFLMTPEQHRRRAQNMRDFGRPDLARQHELLAQAIECRRERQTK
jgi:hypothetical protein